MYKTDTIVACATPPGRGGVAIVRLSGPEARDIGQRLFKPGQPGPLKAWGLRHGHALDPGRQESIDEALAVLMPAPHSYTGEDTVEIHCHGSPLVVERIVAAAVSVGARVAERGEFSRRAVLNGRMDLLQAEAVLDLINAPVEAGVRQAWQQLQGALSQRLQLIRGSLVAELAEVEANVDFSDEELPEENSSLRMERLETATTGLQALLDGFAASRRSREGLRTVFCGRPNVGKSSLINALLGQGRMIVSDEPGTTRDAVEETVDLGGQAFVLTDTAGVRETSSKAEGLAVATARQRMLEADIAVVVIDGSLPLGGQDRQLLAAFGPDGGSAGAVKPAVVVVVNKIDLPDGLSGTEHNYLNSLDFSLISTSALDPDGCHSLAQALLLLARERGPEEGQQVGISRLRHREAIARACDRLRATIALVVDGGGTELVAMELRASVDELASITEPLDNEEVLDRIFGEFCIGK